MNERHTPEDFKTLQDAQFVFEERMNYAKEELDRPYLTERARVLVEERIEEIVAERRNIFIALGLEEPDGSDLIT